jgi:endonuclease/exonuclease/phosphatase family metal-dependent hydrolase
MDGLYVATLNILNLADRWFERLPLLLADMAALQPDVLALQEVVYVMQQDRLIGAAGEGRYGAVRGWAGRPEYGNSLLIREPLIGADVERLDLDHQRAAHRAHLSLPGGEPVVSTTTHLDHEVDGASTREAQVIRLIDWLAPIDPATPQIVMGDFNADPREPTYRRMIDAGFVSAYATANGGEPALTWPSGLQAPAMDTDGDPDCLDYIWLRGQVRAIDVGLVFDRPAADDPTLYPSDHFGLSARVEIGPASEVPGS